MPETAKNKVKRDVGEFLVESVLTSLSKADSPVKGEKWPALSPKYKALKKHDGLPPVPDMGLHGDMLDSLSFQSTDDGLELGFFGSQAWKADGHLKFSGSDGTAPRRRFLPGEGQEFDSDIQKKAEQIVVDAISENLPFDRADFEDISTQAALYETLSNYFGDMSRAEMKFLVTSSTEFSDLLDELGILELL